MNSRNKVLMFTEQHIRSIKIITLLIVFASNFSLGQEKNIAEQLGYPKDAKLLIVHADDIGVAHSVNKATIKAFENSGISSASIMVPCPWFGDIAAYCKLNPEKDFGLHLTLTAEWEHYKWDGVLPSSQIPSLINKEGYFYASVEDVVKYGKPEEVEAEIRAQVQRALDVGIDVTHLDTHMRTLFSSPEFFKAYQKVGKEFNIPVFIPKDLLWNEAIAKLIDPWFIPIEYNYTVTPDTHSKDWSTFYNTILDNLKPGLSEIVIHLAYHDDEMKAITINHPDWGSAWRQRDFDYFMSAEFKKKLKANGITLVTYREIKELKR